MARETRVAMNPAEVRDFLGHKDVLILATLDKDDVPVGDVARFILDGDALVFALPRNGRTHRNLQRDNRIACCAEQNPGYFEIAAVSVHGRAREVTESEQVARLAVALDACGAPVPAGRTALKGETVILCVPLGEDVVSFDFAKIADRSRGVNH